MIGNNHSYKCFTIEYDHLARALLSDVIVFDAFDPEKTSPENRPEGLRIQAIWDTGATNSVITREIAIKLGLPVTGQTTVKGVNSEEIVNTYLINVSLPNTVGIVGLKVSEGKLGDFDMLIGMDVIMHGDFAISNQRKTVFTFRMPSKGGFDFTVEEREATLARIGRNTTIKIKEIATGEIKVLKGKKARPLLESGKWQIVNQN